MPQDEDYRNALGAAQRRIEVLANDLQVARAAMPAPPRGTPTWVAVLATIGTLGVGLVGLAGGAALLATIGPAFSDDTPCQEPREPAVPQPAVLGASWYTGGNEGPLLEVDVDGDGDKDIVSLFWRAPEDASLFVAAVDRDTLQPIWTAGPYPSQWSGPHTHLVIAGDHVMISDSREQLHVLDVKTGNTVHDLAFPGGAQSACRLAAAPTLIRLDHNYSEVEVLDPAAGTLRKEVRDTKLACADEQTDCKHAQPHQPCHVDDPGAVARSKVKGFSAYGSTLLDDVLFTQGSLVSADRFRSEAWLMSSDAKTKKLNWVSRAALDGDTVHIAGRVSTELTAHVVVTFYQRSTGDFRMVGRATETGQLLWGQIVSGTAEGSFAQLFVQGGELFVNADHRMHLYDLESGSELHVSHGI